MRDEFELQERVTWIGDEARMPRGSTGKVRELDDDRVYVSWGYDRDVPRDQQPDAERWENKTDLLPGFVAVEDLPPASARNWMSEAFAHKDGLWRLVGGEWVRFQIAYVAPHVTHAMKVGAKLTVCGRLPTYVNDPGPTDTPSMVDCDSCTAYLLGTTR